MSGRRVRRGCPECNERRELSLVKPPEPRHAWPYSKVLDVNGDASYVGKHRSDGSS